MYDINDKLYRQLVALRAAGVEGEFETYPGPDGRLRLASIDGFAPREEPGLRALTLAALGAGRDLQARLRRLSLGPAEHVAALSLLREIGEDGHSEQAIRRWLFSKARRRWGTAS